MSSVAPPAKCSTGFGRLAWVTVPVAIIVVIMALRGENPAAPLPGSGDLQGASLDRLDQYAQPDADGANAEPDGGPPAPVPAPVPDAKPTAEPAEVGKPISGG